MSALEQSFRDVCAEHGLDTLSVHISRKEGMEWFTVYAHAGQFCASGSGDTIAQAVGNAIAGLHAKRGTAEPIALADEPLPELAA